jgi:hypothetical protein
MDSLPKMEFIKQIKKELLSLKNDDRRSILFVTCIITIGLVRYNTTLNYYLIYLFIIIFVYHFSDKYLRNNPNFLKVS